MVYVVDAKGRIRRASYCSCFKCRRTGYLVPETKTIYCVTCNKPIAVFVIEAEDHLEQIFPKPRQKRRRPR